MKKAFSKVMSMLNGLFIVLKYGFKRPVTIRYPEEKRKLPARSRGRHYLTKWDDGLERCVGCELCAIVCPSQAIYVKPAENQPGDIHSHGERYASDFQINMIRCIYCGYCEEACPTGAIILSNEYELSSFDRESLIFTKDKLTEKKPGDSGRDPHREI
ncbi:NADH-quinone oxidoreductase subunit NuoI [Candidatus Protochlamydia phocaeensis]|uniref:NADH-quinone oxidoreductase subunit NuoI n=1 Tax=Candidatus Protochlamydia phocaeensis TaxID=1414722 RepID=UPI0008399D67|nr:NADH-quinone oxidoreductase subunit NuoI [Candidatus Protochlamydia phocaeensis]